MRRAVWLAFAAIRTPWRWRIDGRRALQLAVQWTSATPYSTGQLESDAVMRDQPNRSKTRFLRFQLLGIQHPLDLSICQHYNNTSFKRLVCYFRLTTIDNKSRLQLYRDWLPWVDTRNAMPIFQSENLNSKLNSTTRQRASLIIGSCLIINLWF
jgi:hypothetical protein